MPRPGLLLCVLLTAVMALAVTAAPVSADATTGSPRDPQPPAAPGGAPQLGAPPADAVPSNAPEPAAPTAGAPVRLVVNGRELQPDVPPIIQDGRTLVPVRAVAEALGALVSWREETRRVYVRMDDRWTELGIDQELAWVAGDPVVLDVPPRIVNGRTLVPIRFIAESLGMKVDWDDATRTVTVGPFHILGVVVDAAGGQPRVQVQADGGVTYRVDRGDDPPRVVVEIPYAVLAPETPRNVQGDGRYVRQVTVEALDGGSGRPASVRVVVDLTRRLQDVVTYSDKRITIGFQPEVTDVTWGRYFEGTQLRISTTFPARYASEAQDKERRILIDFPDTRLRFGQRTFEVNEGIVRRIVSGPGLLPGWSRLTVELTEPARLERAPSSDDTLLILNLRSPLALAGKGRRVFIDPGHGGAERGARGPSGLAEKDVNLAISLKLKALLEQAGFAVAMSRTGDQTVGLRERPAMAARAGAEIFVSIHSNAFTSPREGGTELYHYNGHPGSRRLAEALHKALQEGVGLYDRGVKNHEPFVVIKEATMPAVLVEVAFLSNPQEERLLGDPAFQERVARALLQGIAAYFAGDGR